MSIYLHLDTLAHQNRLRYLPPQQKLGFGLEVLGLAWVTHWPVQLLLLAWVSVWLLVYAKIPGPAYRQLLGMATGFLFVGVVVLMVNVVPVTAMAAVGTDEVLGVSWGGGIAISVSRAWVQLVASSVGLWQPLLVFYSLFVQSR